MDKFLQVAWQSSRIGSQANFDIDRDNLVPGQLSLPLREILPRKVGIFEAELENCLKKGLIANKLQGIELCVQHGIRRRHAESVLKDLKKKEVIKLDFRFPDIRNLKSSRPIQLIAS